MKKINLALCGAIAHVAIATSAVANENDNDVQDMSDPLAVYSVAGLGYTDRGFNLKLANSYDTGDESTMAMNVLELKGFGGQDTGFSQEIDPDNSIDSFRLRNFKVDTTTGRGLQIDLSYDVERENLNASYSFIQALPKMGRVQLFPLAGVGVSVQNNAVDRIEDGEAVIDDGYSVEGAFGIVGVYTKIDLTESIWFNYNPMYTTAVSGSDFYKDNAYGKDNSEILLHEIALSYQLDPRTNVRYFANFSDEVMYKDGEHRIEFNYQF